MIVGLPPRGERRLVREAVADLRGAVPQLWSIPVRQLNCCSGDLADLKVEELRHRSTGAPRQQKYFEVCSCSNLGDAQARRLHIRIKGKDGKTYLARHLDKHLRGTPAYADRLPGEPPAGHGSVTIPKCSQPYMGGLKVMAPTNKKD